MLESWIRRFVWLLREKRAIVLIGGASVLISAFLVSSALRRPALLNGSMSLSQLLKEATRRATEAKALVPLTTKMSILQDAKLPIVLSTLAGEAHKAKAHASNGDSVKAAAAPSDAFAKIDASQPSYIGTVGPAHVAVLNKFWIIPQHTVIATKDFKPQAAPMDRSDWAALWSMLRSVEGLGFYNCGPQSGASQPRRHMQLIPGAPLQAALAPLYKALGPATPRITVPVELPIAKYRSDTGFRDTPGTPFSVPSLPFAHGVVVLGSDLHRASTEDAAATLHAWYQRLLSSTGCACSTPTGEGEEDIGNAIPETPRPGAGAGAGAGAASPRAACPSHNMLITPQWMMVVPRTQGEYEGISVNALGYAGLFLAQGDQAAVIERVGGLEVLRACAAVPQA